MKTTRRFSYSTAALLLAAACLILHLMLHPAGYDLQRDEYLYLADGQHLAWGYMEMPPMTALLAFTVKLAGYPIWLVRFWPALFGSLTLLTAAALLRRLGGGLFALVLLSTAYLFSPFLRLNLLFQPNSLDVLLWTLVAYEGICYLDGGASKRLLRIGLWIGLGLLNKYTMGFLVLGLLAGMMLDRRWELLRNRWLWAAAGLAGLLWLPNLIWQLHQGVPFFHHMAMLEHGQLQQQGPWSFLLGQFILLASMLLWLPALWILFVGTWAKSYRLWGWVCLVVLVLLDAFHGKLYYSFGLYPALMAFGARFWERCSLSWKHPAWRWALVLPSLLLTLPVLPLLYPIWSPACTARFARDWQFSGLLRWEDGRNHALPQDYADMLGWKDLAQKTARIYQSLSPEQQAHTLIFCDNYGEAGALSFYGPKLGLPTVYSDQASFLYWLPDSMVCHNLLLVTPDSMEQRHPFARDMDSIRVMDQLNQPLAREYGTRIYMFYGLHPAFERMLAHKLQLDRQAADFMN